MKVLEEMAIQGHEQVVFGSDPEIGYRGIIAIHDTTLGPALGGTRFWSYDSEEEAVADALRLARGMTYKAAIAGVSLGGGKSVLIGDNRMPSREMIFRRHGRLIDSLGGRYIAAEDVGTTVEDMEFVRMETEYVSGLKGGSGDPSPVTAWGTFQGMKACAEEVYGDPSLEGKHVTVQGLGNVGTHLCALLAKDGARLTVADLDPDRVQHAVRMFRSRAVPPDEIVAVEADFFAPCALGGAIHVDTIERLRVRIVAGAANNQLETPDLGEVLHRRGILYAPDYVINAGGLINVYGELQGWTSDRSLRKAGEIKGTLHRIFDLARAEEVTPVVAADRLAEKRIREARHIHRSRG
jgi:leucine dehydrogenase